MGLLSTIGKIAETAADSVISDIATNIGGQVPFLSQYLGILDGKVLTDTFLDVKALSKPNPDKLASYIDIASRTYQSWQQSTDQLERFKSKNNDSNQFTTLQAGQESTVTTTKKDLIKLPNWGYDDFINERAVWQKGLSTPYGEPGYFYFKVFFDFNTDYGLFGGILNRANPYNSVNSAYKYLSLCLNNYSEYNIKARLETLQKFVRTLSYININAPWFFKSVKGLDKADNPIVSEFSREKTIELEFFPDAIDMRLTSLFGMYKYICYDDINGIEILPANLRKFDMSVMIFETPIRYLHTAFTNGGLFDVAKNSVLKLLSKKSSGPAKNYFDYKSASPIGNDYGNVMSFKLYTFVNCEIKIDSIGNMTPASVSNDVPFKMGNSSITITYDRCYTTQNNEFMRFMWGSTGIYFNQYASIVSQIDEQKQSSTGSSGFSFKQIAQQAVDSVKNVFGLSSKTSDVSADLQQQRYKAMKKIYDYSLEAEAAPQLTREVVDASEKLIHNNLSAISGLGFGNIYGEDKGVSIKNLLSNGTHASDYWKQKMAWLKQHHKSNDNLRSIGRFLSGMIGGSDASYYDAPEIISQYGEGINPYTNRNLNYWKAKLKFLKGYNATDIHKSTPSIDRGTQSTHFNDIIYTDYVNISDTKKAYNTKNSSNDALDQFRSDTFINQFGQGIAKYGVGTPYWFEKIRNLKGSNLTTNQNQSVNTEITNMVAKMKKGTLPGGQPNLDEMKEMIKKIKK